MLWVEWHLFKVFPGFPKEMSTEIRTVKRLLPMQETLVRTLGWEDPLEKEMATHSSTLAWKIPWTEEPGRLQSMELQRVGHDWATSLSLRGRKWSKSLQGVLLGLYHCLLALHTFFLQKCFHPIFQESGLNLEFLSTFVVLSRALGIDLTQGQYSRMCVVCLECRHHSIHCNLSTSTWQWFAYYEFSHHLLVARPEYVSSDKTFLRIHDIPPHFSPLPPLLSKHVLEQINLYFFTIIGHL